MLEMMQLQLQTMQLPHWLIVAGCALLIVGAGGLLIRRAQTQKEEQRVDHNGAQL